MQGSIGPAGIVFARIAGGALVFGLIALVVAVVAGWFVAGALARRVRRLEAEIGLGVGPIAVARGEHLGVGVALDRDGLEHVGALVDRDAHDVGALERHHLAEVALVHGRGGLEAEAGGEHAVGCRRRAAAHHVAEARDAQLVADQLAVRLVVLHELVHAAARAFGARFGWVQRPGQGGWDPWTGVTTSGGGH